MNCCGCGLAMDSEQAKWVLVRGGDTDAHPFCLECWQAIVLVFP